MIRPLTCGLLVASLIGVAGCVAPSPTPTPALAFIPGPTPTVYSGTMVDSIDGSGPLTVSLASSNGLTSGYWQAEFGSATFQDGEFGVQRFISGAVSGSSYTARVDMCLETDTTSCSPDCSYSFTGTLTSSSLTGTYMANAIQPICPARSGSVSLTKQ